MDPRRDHEGQHQSEDDFFKTPDQRVQIAPRRVDGDVVKGSVGIRFCFRRLEDGKEIPQYPFSLTAFFVKNFGE